MGEVSHGSERFQWTAFPLRESPHKGVLFWVIVVATIWAIYWNFGSIPLTAIAAILLLGSLSSFYLPTHYTIDEVGVRVKRVLHNKSLSWSRIRSVADELEGLFVSPFPVKSRLENFRGVFLPYRNNRDRIIELVREYAPDVNGLPKVKVGEGDNDLSGTEMEED